MKTLLMIFGMLLPQWCEIHDDTIVGVFVRWFGVEASVQSNGYDKATGLYVYLPSKPIPLFIGEARGKCKVQLPSSK